MSFRKIRPSFGDSSASTSTPSQATPESSGSDPRRARGEKEVADNSNTSSKRRRVPESVTRNACLNCKKARAKCDGKKPCKRCAARQETADCIYEIHIKHAKEELVKQIKELKGKNHLQEQILQAFASGSDDEKIPELVERLQRQEQYESIVEWLGRSSIEDLDTLSPRESQQPQLDASDHEMGGVSTGWWTTVTKDKAVLDHLMQLYFAWIHPVHTLFDEGHFVDDYSRQLENYCSSVLVNSMCALACHLHPQVEGEDVDYEQLGMEFSDAARIGIDPVESSLTMVQTFAVMFLVDCARANGLRGSSYLRVATSNLRNIVHQENKGFADVWRSTVRGIRNLNIEWSQVTFQIPPVNNLAIYDTPEESDDRRDDAKWYFYRSSSDSNKFWPGFLATTNREKTKLTTIIHDVVTILYSPGGPLISAHDVWQQYRRFLAWRNQLSSDIVDFERPERQALPHVLSLLILYNSSVVQLLRPLLRLRSFNSTIVSQAIWKHAQDGLFLADEHYQTQFGCRFQPVLQMFAVLHLSDTIARDFPGGIEGRSKDGPEAIQFGLEALMHSHDEGRGFPVAERLQELLRKEAEVCSIRLPRSFDLMVSAKPGHQVYRIDDMIEACTRPSYTQPLEDILPRLAPSFSADWAVEESSGGFRSPPTGPGPGPGRTAEERGAAQNSMHIRNLLNTN